MNTRYSVEFIEERPSGFIAASILARESDLDVARALFKFCAGQFPNRIILLADRARVLARSDYGHDA